MAKMMLGGAEEGGRVWSGVYLDSPQTCFRNESQVLLKTVLNKSSARGNSLLTTKNVEDEVSFGWMEKIKITGKQKLKEWESKDRRCTVFNSTLMTELQTIQELEAGIPVMYLLVVGEQEQTQGCSFFSYLHSYWDRNPWKQDRHKPLLFKDMDVPVDVTWTSPL